MGGLEDWTGGRRRGRDGPAGVGQQARPGAADGSGDERFSQGSSPQAGRSARWGWGCASCQLASAGLTPKARLYSDGGTTQAEGGSPVRLRPITAPTVLHSRYSTQVTAPRYLHPGYCTQITLTRLLHPNHTRLRLTLPRTPACSTVGIPPTRTHPPARYTGESTQGQATLTCGSPSSACARAARVR